MSIDRLPTISDSRKPEELGPHKEGDLERGPHEEFKQKLLQERITSLRSEYHSLRTLFENPASMMDVLKRPLGILKAKSYIKSLQDSTAQFSEGITSSKTREETLSFLSELQGTASSNKQWGKFQEGISGVVAHITLENLDAVRPSWEVDSPETVASSVSLMETALAEITKYPHSEKHQEAEDVLSSAIIDEFTYLHSAAPHMLEDDAGRAKLQYAGSLVGTVFEKGTRATREAARPLFMNLLMEKSSAVIPYTPTHAEKKRSTRLSYNRETNYGGIMTAALDRVVNESFGYGLENPSSDSPERMQFSHAVFTESLTQIGLDSEVFMDSARRSLNGLTEKTDLVDGVNTAWEIESERAGAVSELSGIFGIQSFGRYPSEVLIRQYDERNDQIPYGIVMYPRDDHEGAFTKESTREMFGGFSDYSKEQGYGIRIFEADSGMSATKKLMRANEKYGTNHKISFALVGGHGSSEGFVLGKKESGVISTLDVLLSSPRFDEMLRGLFIDKPTIIFDSCSVGTDDGIGKTFSDIYGARVLASDVNIKGISHIDFEKEEDGSLKFDVSYFVGEGSGMQIKEAKRFG